MALLFVYGTLKSGFDNRWARLLRANAHLMGPAEIQGKLFRMRGYPALRVTLGSATVHGELWQIRGDGLRLFARLDEYEGARYRRVELNITCGGRRYRAFVYEWRWRLPEQRRIADGVFVKRKAAAS